MTKKSYRTKKSDKVEQSAIINRHARRMQIDIRRALLPNTILFFIKKRPHYSLEIHQKISSFSQRMTSFAEDNVKMATFTPEYLKLGRNIVYNNLLKLEKKGIVASYREASRMGPKRKYYYLTEFGEQFFEEIIVKRLYPRIFMLYCFFDAAIPNDDILSKFTAKHFQNFQKYVHELTS